MAMTEWTVVGVIAALVALIASLVKPMVSLTKIITELGGTVKLLSDKVETLNGGLSDMIDQNSKSHARMFERIDDHEIRIVKLETKTDK